METESLEHFHSVSLYSLVLISCPDDEVATKDVSPDADECSHASRQGEVLDGHSGSKPH